MNIGYLNLGAAISVIVVLLMSGCGYGSGRIESTECTCVSEAVRESGRERSREDLAEAVCRRIGDINFPINEHPIDKERYNFQTDRIYKEAFQKAVTNQVPIYNQDKKESVFYKDLLQDGRQMKEEEFLRSVMHSDFYYQDFDGDGLPELTVNTEGPCVLKYAADKDMVELYYMKEPGWNLLGTGQMFFYSDNSYHLNDKGMSYIYAYEIADEGKGKQRVTFYHTMTPDYSDWIHTYKVSLDEEQETEVDEEQWEKLISTYFGAKEQAPHPMSFSDMFGDGKSGGYFPGSEPTLRYLPEEREYLPLNEETGEEWEAYKKMLKGDFSLVEDERWVSLQSRYESDLLDGNGTCGWSYFLMDFNQDGLNELCIRYYPEGVNNTAFFRYEDGKIKMWGSFGSADSHGYDVPLRNGKMMSVYWYQDDKIQWISRLDSDFYHITEREFETGTTNEEDDECSRDTGETKKVPYYTFQDHYCDGQLCGGPVPLSEGEWTQIQDMIEELIIPESAWKSCSVFTPLSDRPEIPGEG